MLLFDFDGTLVDSRAVFLSLYNDLALKKGYGLLTDENLPRLQGMNIPERCRQLHIPLYKIPLIAAALLRNYESQVSEVAFYPQVRETLLELNDREYPYAVVSSNSAENIRAVFFQNDIPVPGVCTSSRIFGKDRLIDKVIKAINLQADQVLYVGDELRDLQACRKAGVRMAWVPWGYDTRAALGSLVPDYELQQPADVLRLLPH